MRKRVKRLNLNASNKAHDKLMAKNLFTSLLMYGKITTTKPRAKAVKAYALSKVNAYKKLTTSLEQKRWLNAEVSTKTYAKRVANKITGFENFAVSVVMAQPRKGDNAQRYEVSILNYDAEKKNE